MNDLTKTQIATYLGKSDKIVDEVTEKLFKIVKYNIPESDPAMAKNILRDIIVGVIHCQLSTALVTAETLFVQGNLMLDCEGDIREVMDIPIGAESDNRTEYSRKYCNQRHCGERVQDGCSDGDEFYCGNIKCESRAPSDVPDVVTDNFDLPVDGTLDEYDANAGGA